MKINALIVVFVLCASVARAQLDQILAPLPIGEKTTSQEQIAADANGDLSVQQAAQPAAQAPNQLTADALLNDLQKQLVSYFGLKGDLKLTIGQSWRPLPLPGKDFQITLTDYPSEGVTNSFAVRFKVKSGGVDVGEYQVAVRAQMWETVWVTQGQMDKGQALDASLLNVEKIDALRDRATFLSADMDPSGYDVAQGIGAGRPIAKQDVIERPIIHRGDVVEVVATHGMLDIRMKALALEDGGMNALIKLKNLDSNKAFTAQILNENEVKVQF